MFLNFCQANCGKWWFWVVDNCRMLCIVARSLDYWWQANSIAGKVVSINLSDLSVSFQTYWNDVRVHLDVFFVTFLVGFREPKLFRWGNGFADFNGPEPLWVCGFMTCRLTNRWSKQYHGNTALTSGVVAWTYPSVFWDKEGLKKQDEGCFFNVEANWVVTSQV